MFNSTPYKNVYSGVRNTVYEQRAGETEIQKVPNWTQRQNLRQSFFKRRRRLAFRPAPENPGVPLEPDTSPPVPIVPGNPTSPTQPPPDGSDGPDSFDRGPWRNGDVDMTVPGYFMLGTSGSLRAIGGIESGDSLGSISGFFNDDFHFDNAGTFTITFYETSPGGVTQEVGTFVIGVDRIGEVLIPVRHLYVYSWEARNLTQVSFGNNGTWHTNPDGVHNKPGTPKTNQFRLNAEARNLFGWALAGRTSATGLPQ